ncbi:MAG: hypothetical protein JWQ21_2991 [Herminiimonas sp.]|nr:hypothetical protein [Herminiimonas sp.]
MTKMIWSRAAFKSRSVFHAASIILFATTYLLVVGISVHYDVAWTQPEANYWRNFVATHEISTLKDYAVNALNWPVFEQEPRLSRPLASFFEIIDSQFKIWFANQIFPHPSLSITWLLSLIFSPVLLFKGLRNYEIPKPYCWLGTAIYLATPGFLSLVAMSFRVSKPIATFFLVLIFFLISYYRKYTTQDGNHPKAQIFSVLVPATVFISLFFDETALFGIIFACFLLWHAQRNSRPLDFLRFFVYQSAIYGLVIALYFLTIAKLMPILASSAGFPVRETYELQTKFFHLISNSVQDYDAFFSIVENVWFNIVQVFGDLTGFTLSQNTVGSKSFAITILIVCVHAFIFISFFRKYKGVASLFGLLVLASIAAHTALVLLANSGVWGVYWYGVFIVLPWTLYLTWALSSIDKKGLSIGVVAITVSMSLFTFIRTNHAYKAFHYYPYDPGNLYKIFAGELDRFELYAGKRQLRLFDDTERFWTLDRKAKNGASVISLPAELTYLSILSRNYNPECKAFVQGEKIASVSFEDFYAEEGLYNTPNAPQREEPYDAFLGTWYSIDGRTAFIFRDSSGTLNAMNENGHCNELIKKDTSLVPRSWAAVATLSRDSSVLDWHNGAFWFRNCPDKCKRKPLGVSHQ